MCSYDLIPGLTKQRTLYLAFYPNWKHTLFNKNFAAFTSHIFYIDLHFFCFYFYNLLLSFFNFFFNFHFLTGIGFFQTFDIILIWFII